MIYAMRESDIARKVAFLRQVAAYPELPRRVDVRETHMSWVFLTDERAYKLKKPVRRDYLDFSTVEARRLNCQEELRLNRRLAGPVYRSVVPLLESAGGKLGFAGPGQAVDWLVVMNRLPEHAALDHRLRRGTARPEEIERVVLTLAPFYRAAEKAGVNEADYRRRFADAIALDHAKLLAPPYGLPAGQVEEIAAGLASFLDRRGGLLAERARADMIVEAHGDLRPEHVFFAPEPLIIDCLEFNRDMRLLDPAEELAYLSMECGAIGADWVGGRLLFHYGRLLDDEPPEPLIRFYRARRAFLRARLAAEHLDTPAILDPAKWRAKARAYLALALGDARAALA
jgi:aminoglycoside phosphotransferase family enzyme